MIKKITIKNIASFDESGQIIDNLSKINFFYGTNGSGKTTISKIIDNENNYSQCSIEYENNIPLKTFVYNKDFVEKNFFQVDKIKGVFTLGEKSKKIEEKLKNNREKIDELNKKLGRLKNTFEKKEKEKAENESWFEEKCWTLKQKYDKYFFKAFKGCRNSKNKFKDKILSEINNNNNSELKVFEELKEKAKTIFKDSLEKVGEIKLCNFDGLVELETDSILRTKIIGKEDVDIAAMIRKLNNSDWVKQGKVYYEQNNGICPFCQQPTSETFKKQLEDYFDETFTKQLNRLKQLLNDYDSKTKDIINEINYILKLENDFLDKDFINKEKEIISVTIMNNKSKIQNKINETSKVIEIDSIISNLNKINEKIKQANDKIKEHNNIVDNITIEKKELISQIWRFIISEIDTDYQIYKKKHTNFEKAINSISKQIEDTENKIMKLTEEIRRLESRIVSIRPTINAINKLLFSFGFTNFKLEESEKKGYYKIIRENGEDARNTLSEGEKTFITFLYFYHLLQGSTEEGIITTNNKIVVFDDPISSLDSGVLFIVSSLIRKIIKEVRDNIGTIKQVFVFTHNVHFHKEVTFISNREKNSKREDTTYWIIRKINNKSILQYYDTNPIKTSY